MGIVVRPMTSDDVEAVREVQTRSFDAYDRAHGEQVSPPTEQSLSRQRTRIQHFLTHDPRGSWVATAHDIVVGAALALRRDDMWGLSLLAVDPDAQSRGIGRRLLDASLRYATAATTAVILSSEDPRAMRAYASAGFDLHPQVEATGVVERSLLPGLKGRVHAVQGSRAEWADAIDRHVRGAARGPDHEVIGGMSEKFIVDDVDGRGYAYVRNDGRIVAVSATDDATATALLWQCLATDHEGERSVSHVNGAQQWAIRVAVAARLRLKPAGPVYWRGRLPPPSYLPDGAYL